MTLPDERYRSVKWAESFLSRLAGGDIPRVPKAVRDEARSILRHYPNSWDMQRTAAVYNRFPYSAIGLGYGCRQSYSS